MNKIQYSNNNNTKQISAWFVQVQGRVRTVEYLFWYCTGGNGICKLRYTVLLSHPHHFIIGVSYPDIVLDVRGSVPIAKAKAKEE